MPHETKQNSGSSKKRKKRCCVYAVRRWNDQTTVLSWIGPGTSGTLLLLGPCETRAELARTVAYNNCVLQGGTPEECNIEAENVYSQVLEECQVGG